jgi:hypothetical protein
MYILDAVEATIAALKKYHAADEKEFYEAAENLATAVINLLFSINHGDTPVSEIYDLEEVLW